MVGNANLEQNAMPIGDMKEMVMPPSKLSELATIEREICDYKRKGEDAYLEIGRLLLQAKPIVGPYGMWLKWLQNNVDVSVCKAQRLMKVAAWMEKENAAPVPHLTFTQAYVLTKLSREKMNNFLEWLKAEDASSEPFNGIHNMSKRELEKAIREYLSSSTTVPHTQKEQKHEASSPVTSPEDSALDTLCHLEDTMSGLMKNIMNRQVDDETYDTLISEIRRLCEDTLGKLPTEDVELE